MELLARPLDELCAEARALRDQGHGRLVTFSPKVFIPLTKLCRDVCHYCTFAQPPRRGERAYMTIEEVLGVARAGAAVGCREALFTLGDKPELRYRVAREELAEQHGHVQEVIVQNFRAKSGTRMADAPEPPLEELLWAIAVARILLGAHAHLQAPPNLSYDEFPRLLDAGIDDWGGVSPVTIDHVNPEAPWPELERLRAATEGRDLELAPRLPVYPEWISGEWLDPRVIPAVLRAP